MQRIRLVFVVSLVTIIALLPGNAIAQTPEPQQSSVVATGTGEATAPAASVTLQLLLGSAMNFGMGPMMGMVESGPGTPTAMGPGMMGMPAQVSEESLAPVVQALIEAGVPQDVMTVTVPASTEAFGFGGPEIGEIVIELDQAGGTQVNAIVDAAREGASPTGLVVIHTGATYEPADCAALLQEARDAAIADAQQRVEGLAASLGGSLGSLIQASEAPFFGAAGNTTCDPAGEVYGPYGPGTLPAFDPRSAEAEVYLQVTLTYVLELGA